jgi:hypothetical protein
MKAEASWNTNSNICRGDCEKDMCSSAWSNGTIRRRLISCRGSHRCNETFAYQTDLTRTNPSSGPSLQTPLEKPSNFASSTNAQASSSTSRSRVCLQPSLPSVRPPGRSQDLPSVLTNTMFPSSVTQTPAEPCGAPPGGPRDVGCHEADQSWPLERKSNSSLPAGISPVA